MSLTERLLQPTPVLRADQPIAEAARALLASDLRTLPVVDARDRFVGVFGEREFLAALFPGYIRELRYAAFVRAELDEAFERRANCATEPVSRFMTAERVDAARTASDLQLAETFLHHRVSVIPVTEHRRVVGVITRGDFFRACAEGFLEKVD
jgi:CBS domain-containing protein